MLKWQVCHDYVKNYPECVQSHQQLKWLQLDEIPRVKIGIQTDAQNHTQKQLSSSSSSMYDQMSVEDGWRMDVNVT